MHAKFNLAPEQNNWSEYIDAGREIHKDNQNIVRSKLDIFKKANNALEAKNIIENWFPDIEADVFLSHSHKDADLIIGLAGWLYTEFNIKAFIDSTVWGYANNLLKMIDDACCRLNPSGNTYNYNLRNQSTSHVHMMLSTALTEMIDRCECIIFVNTQNSFTPKDYIEGEGKTESPWIYSEIAMTRIIRQRSPEEHRKRRMSDSYSIAKENMSTARSVHIEYETDLLHLTPLSIKDLNKWARESKSQKLISHPLDLLYNLKRK